jgi:phospholipid/cholesterol/gamma-HCH transport system permease protein
VLRELGVLFAAILVAGRSGSAFTAQIGTMKVNQEVDAMQTIGLSPVDVLVLPRILALMVALPLLTIYADLVGLAGGAAICSTVLDIPISAFTAELATAIDTTTFWIGMVKAPVFAFVIAVIGCYEGFKVSGSAESVGHRTTTSVVESIFMVIGIDAAFAIALSYLGI